MNPLIKTQLNKLKSTVGVDFDESTTQITIPRNSYTPNPTELAVDQCYLISVEDYILKPPEGFTLHTNWNNNKIPKDKVMKVDVLTKMGKMIKVNSIGYDMKNQRDTSNMWEGWLPEKSITIIERL